MTQCKSTDIFSRNLDILLKWNARDAVSSIKVETFEQEIFFWGGGSGFYMGVLFFRILCESRHHHIQKDLKRRVFARTFSSS